METRQRLNKSNIHSWLLFLTFNQPLGSWYPSIKPFELHGVCGLTSIIAGYTERTGSAILSNSLRPLKGTRAKCSGLIKTPTVWATEKRFCNKKGRALRLWKRRSLFTQWHQSFSHRAASCLTSWNSSRSLSSVSSFLCLIKHRTTNMIFAKEKLELFLLLLSLLFLMFPQYNDSN